MLFWGMRYTRFTNSDLTYDTINVFSNIPDSPFAFAQDICFGSTRWLRAWRRVTYYMGGVYETNSYFNFLDENGIPVGTNRALDSIWLGQSWTPSLTIAYDGLKYLCVYDHDNAIMGRFFDDTNDSLSAKFEITNASHGRLKMSFNGAKYLVVYADAGDIYGFRLDQQGVLLDTAKILICGAVGTQSNPVAAFNGTNYIVAWEDSRSGTQTDIYGAWVASDGSVSNNYLLSENPGDKTQLAISRGAGDQVFLLWKGYVDSINGHYVNNMRIWGRFIDNATGVADAIQDYNSKDYDKLYSNYPNPFKQTTYFKYQINSNKANVKLNIYNVMGQLVKSIVNGSNQPGQHIVQWDGRNELGSKVAPGVYIYSLQVDGFKGTKKMVIVQ